MRTALLPKEHGAYGQMAFPLVTALGVAGVTPAAMLAAVAIVAGFLAHEPALVLLGLRGPRARRELGPAALPWLALLGAITTVGGISALLLTPSACRWTFALPLAPSLLVMAAIAKREEKSGHAEIAVALTFALAAVPLCVAGGGTLRQAAAIAVPFALIFVAGTLAVRTLILRVRGGGNPGAMRATRAAALIFIVCGVAATAMAIRSGWIPSSALVAAGPGLVLAAAVALTSPSPKHLKTIGWLLVGASTIAAIVAMMRV